jgi:hypothetical protein
VDAAARLRARYPHLLQALPRAVLQVSARDAANAGRRAPASGGGGASARDLLGEFWSFVEGTEAAAPTLDVLESALHRAREQDAAEPPGARAAGRPGQRSGPESAPGPGSKEDPSCALAS